MTTTFPLTRPERLRKRATKLSQAPEDGPQRWSKSVVDPTKAVALFNALWVKGGCIFRAYRACEDGNGISDAVVLLNRGGFRTFTSCEGGRGHSFQHETIGLELEGSYSAFHKSLVRFLRSHGMECFTIILVTDYHPSFPKGSGQSRRR